MLPLINSDSWLCGIFHRFLLLLRAVRESYVPRCLLHQPGHVHQVTASFPSATSALYSHTRSLTSFLLTGYKMVSSYFAGGKCITPNRNSMVSKPYGNLVYKVFTGHKWFVSWVEHVFSVEFCFIFPLFWVFAASLNPHSLSSSDPKAETRLYVTVNGFEFHVYNRTDLYARLQETFGLEPTLTTPKKDEERGREDTKKTLERSEQRRQGQLSLSAGVLSSLPLTSDCWVFTISWSCWCLNWIR